MWCRDLGSCARGKRIMYTLAVTSVYQKLNNLPQSQTFHSLGAGILAHGVACRFLGGSIVLHFLSVFVKLPLCAFQVCPVRVPRLCLVPPRLWTTLTQFVPTFNSDLFLFGLCSLQQIGYVLARQLGISTASVTFNCPHGRSDLSRGRFKAFLRLLW